MKIRFWKELRALAPWFAMAILVGVAAIAVVHWFPPAKIPVNMPEHMTGNILLSDLQSFMRQTLTYCDRVMQIVGLLEIVILALAASDLFGSEFAHGSIQRLLAQPISRDRIWLEKSLIMTVLIVIVLVMNSILTHMMGAYINKADSILRSLDAPYPGLDGFRQHMYPFPWEMFMIGLMALATAPTICLFLRQTHTTFWATLVAPIMGFVLLIVICTLLDALIFRRAGFSVLDSFMKAPEWVTDRPVLDSGWWQLIVPGTMWTAILYPLGWLKFRRLEV